MNRPGQTVMMEDHDRAYQAWEERGVHGMTLVHVDAHIDFGWIPEMDLDEVGAVGQGAALLNPFIISRRKMVTIGNYICPAIREGMVSRFFWVVPDAAIGSPEGRRYIKDQLGRLLRVRGDKKQNSIARGGVFRASLLGRELVVCGLDGLERIEEEVLLDIDTDFMLTPDMRDDLNPARVPWITPQRLAQRLEPKLEKVRLLTIAYSVEGGFTPLRYKYLGDQLRTCLTGEAADGDADRKAAAEHFEKTLAHLDAGEAEQAQACFAECLRRDRSYATIYNNYGILYLRYGRLREAEEHYRKFLALDGNNGSVLCGLGHIALSRRRFREASAWFERAIASDSASQEARRGKALACLRTGELSCAEEFFSGLKAERPDDEQLRWWLAGIARRRGDLDRAIAEYKEAVMRGGEGPLVHLVLSRLYVLKGNFFRAWEELVWAGRTVINGKTG